MTNRPRAMLCLSILAAAVAGIGSPAGASVAAKDAPPPSVTLPADVPIGTASTAVLRGAMKKSAALTPPKGPAQPAPLTVKVFKKGECPLTKGSDGTWRGPDGEAVDDKVAHMGDCKENAR